MSYKITDYSYNQAKKLNVEIKPSSNKKKKIDVYKNGTLIASVGDIRYQDYAHLLQTNPTLAEERRRLYHIRHTKNTVGERFAKQLLW
jgi:hypothetical protein